MEIFKQDVISQLASRSYLSVAIHDGCFHADDVFCVALLRRLAKICSFELKLYRTREPMILANADMRIDVGGCYSVRSWDFDHHQKDIHLMQSEGVKHASIGLLCKWCMDPVFYQIFKEKYLLGLEYQDNTGKPHPKYDSIGFFVQTMLPAYGENLDLNVAFERTVDMAEVILDRCFRIVEGFVQAEKEFSSMVEESIAGGQIVVLKNRIPVVPQLHPELAFIITKAEKGYAFLGVNNHYLKPHLRGLKGSQIEQACGYNGLFTHANGFAGMMKTLEGAKEICVQSL